MNLSIGFHFVGAGKNWNPGCFCRSSNLYKLIIIPIDYMWNSIVHVPCRYERLILDDRLYCQIFSNVCFFENRIVSFYRYLLFINSIICPSHTKSMRTFTQLMYSNKHSSDSFSVYILTEMIWKSCSKIANGEHK